MTFLTNVIKCFSWIGCNNHNHNKNKLVFVSSRLKKIGLLFVSGWCIGVTKIDREVRLPDSYKWLRDRELKTKSGNVIATLKLFGLCINFTFRNRRIKGILSLCRLIHLSIVTYRIRCTNSVVGTTEFSISVLVMNPLEPCTKSN